MHDLMGAHDEGLVNVCVRTVLEVVERIVECADDSRSGR